MDAIFKASSGGPCRRAVGNVASGKAPLLHKSVPVKRSVQLRSHVVDRLLFDLSRIEKQSSRVLPVRRLLLAFRQATEHIASVR
jgi:hypothetical protein